MNGQSACAAFVGQTSTSAPDLRAPGRRQGVDALRRSGDLPHTAAEWKLKRDGSGHY